MRIADDPGNAGELRQFFGSALGVTAGDDDTRSRVGSVELANGVAGLSVRRGCDGAGVHNDDIGGRGFRRGSAAAIEQLALKGGAVRLSSAAAKLFDVKGRHLSLSPSAITLNTESIEKKNPNNG